MSKPKRDVLRATQSPMNAKRWCLDLSCGHEAWVTSNRRPTRQVVECAACPADDAETKMKEEGDTT